MKTSVKLVGALVSMGITLCYVTALASALPVGRAYEMVSPVFKGGYAATERIATGPDGESAAYFSAGAFSGAPSGWAGRFDYLARRTSSGWSTVPLIAPTSLIADFDEYDLSQSLDQDFVIGSPGAAKELPLPDQADIFLHSTQLPDVASSWEPGGSVEHVEHPHERSSPKYRASSNNFCHVLLATGIPLLPQASNASEPLYELNRGCEGGVSSLQLVDVNNAGTLISPKCHTGLGGSQYSGQGSGFNAMSVDGESVFFTVCVGGEETGSASPHQLFVRLDEARTLEISRPMGQCSAPEEVPCVDATTRASADFAGASEDGSIVYFTTSAPLAAATDKDSANDLYMSTIGCPEGKPKCVAGEREVRSLVQISQDKNGRAAEVLGVVRVAPDGSRVYYAARGIPIDRNSIERLEREGKPTPRTGAANLYVYDSGSGTTAFVGDLCTGVELSEAVQDSHCSSGESDSSLWSSNEPEAQTAGTDAGFLVFTSVAQLSENDTNAIKDVYRYDAETDELQRVSIGEDGADANGNASPFGSGIHPSHLGGLVYAQYEMDSRAVSEDGSRIVFTSAAPLSSAATNGLTNAYEWHVNLGESVGSVSLVSTGTSETPVIDVVISPNGRSAFFLTTQGLVPQDTDGASDLYDARLGGGFYSGQAEPGPCQGDACQGPLTNPVPLLVPGSVAQAPGGNFATPKQPVKPKKKVTAKKGSKAKKRSKVKKQHDKRARKTSRRAVAVGGRGR